MLTPVDREMPKGPDGSSRHSAVRDEDLLWLKAHDGLYDKLKLKEFSQSIYCDKNKEGETSRSKEDGDVSQMDCGMHGDDRVSKTMKSMKSLEERTDMSAEDKFNILANELDRLWNDKHKSVVIIEDASQPERAPPAPKFLYPANANDASGGLQVELLCGDLQGLAPNAWFTSSLISLYSLHLSRSLPLEPIENDIESVIERQAMEELEPMGELLWELKDTIYIFMPVHSTDHFSLAVIYKPHKDFSVLNVLYLDSISSPSRSKHVFKNIKKFLEVSVRAEVVNCIDLKVPQQNNSHDCGVHTLYNIQKIITMGAPDDLEDLKKKFKLLKSSHGVKKKIIELREYIKSLVLDNKLVYREGMGSCDCGSHENHTSFVAKWSDALHDDCPKEVRRTSARLKERCKPLSSPL